MGNETTHQLYKRTSPYYQSILDMAGRYLGPDLVRSILKRHGFTEADYTEDMGEPLGAHTDAADLISWLGY
jgi:hypothetical protein